MFIVFVFDGPVILFSAKRPAPLGKPPFERRLCLVVARFLPVYDLGKVGKQPLERLLYSKVRWYV